MARPAEWDLETKVPADTKRLREVYNDYGGSQGSFALILETTQATMSRTLAGTRPVSLKIAQGVCGKLGYSSEWFIFGRGNKKGKDEGAKMITEIRALKVDYQYLLNKVEQMDARMKDYEKRL